MIKTKDKMVLMGVMARVNAIESYATKLHNTAGSGLYDYFLEEIADTKEVIGLICEKYNMDCDRVTYLDMTETPSELVSEAIDIVEDSDCEFKDVLILNLSYLSLSTNLTFVK